jgi:hypothetical protein
VPPVEDEPLEEVDRKTKTSVNERESKESLSLIKWSFGQGNEGVFVQPTASSDNVLVVGRDIPWWGMVIARLYLRISTILLDDFRFYSLVSEYFGSKIPIYKGVNQSRLDVLATRKALEVCSVVAVEKLPLPSTTLSEMWLMTKTRLILVSHGKLIPPPPGWKLCRREMPHAKVGGVTNIVGQIGIYFRSSHVDSESLRGSVVSSARPRRDLRSVLKMAIGGNRCASPIKLSSSGGVGMKVMAVRPGVALNCGLLGVKTNGGLLRIPRVKTLFGGDMWVIRSLSPSELLACWDVPEKLGHLAGTSQGKEDIMNCMFTPIKIRQAALEDLAPVMSELMMSRGAGILKKVDEKCLEKRGPTLRITTPEEERSIFQDRSDPPLNCPTKAPKGSGQYSTGP